MNKIFVSGEEREKKNEDTASDSDETISNLEISVSKQQAFEGINASLEDIRESQMKFHSVPAHCKTSHAKRKIESACDILNTKASKILEKKFSEERTIQFDQDITQKANDMDVLIELIKTKHHYYKKRSDPGINTSSSFMQ